MFRWRVFYEMREGKKKKKKKRGSDERMRVEISQDAGQSLPDQPHASRRQFYSTQPGECSSHLFGSVVPVASRAQCELYPCLNCSDKKRPLAPPWYQPWIPTASSLTREKGVGRDWSERSLALRLDVEGGKGGEPQVARNASYFVQGVHREL